MYELYNKRTTVICNLLKDFISVEECDLLENSIELIDNQCNSFTFEIKPYEIKTFKIKML